MITAAQHNAIVDFATHLLDGVKENTPASRKIYFLRIVSKFPDARIEDISRALHDAADICHEDHLQWLAEYEREKQLNENLENMLTGMPDDMTVEEAAKIKAAQGDHFAIWLLAHPEVLEDEVEI
jgi:hypothetical protein